MLEFLWRLPYRPHLLFLPIGIWYNNLTENFVCLESLARRFPSMVQSTMMGNITKDKYCLHPGRSNQGAFML